jgi:signal transduction histidine kinase
MLGYERDELLRLRFHELFVPDDDGASPIQIEDPADPMMINERRLRAKDGSVVRSEVSTKMLPDGSMLSIVRDFTRRTRAHHASVAACECETAGDGRQLDGMRNLFLTAVSHELRTPLTLVLGIAATLRNRHGLIPEATVVELLERLDRNAKRLDRLLAGVLDLDRLRRGAIEPQRQPTDITLLVHRVIENLSLSRWWFDVEAEGTVTCCVDAGQVERIVENLLINVSRHTPLGTVARVVVRRSGAGVLIAVEDRGPGVPDDVKTRIFEPFEQGSVRQDAPGTGIGLALVARFAALHGGRAWVEDRPGGGASFRVYLPDVPVLAERREPNVIDA